ncbi:hypothetical protein JTE90_027632 [Oedothorax gibbosus]|uniref:Reverse transcriptase RNase H-like domain-containing protein n=1 Tax=Oedothorax gibbosus TaxID=931172 RepID=A0AAV6VLX8_9ARAC|nr:hypothetical protein JTE90_027632 [Oedothorax gibbosus]
MENGDVKPVMFASRTLNSSERNYSQIEREAIAIIFAVKKFHKFLMGHKFVLQTDHKPLTAIFGEKRGIPPIAAARMQRWAIILSAYQYEIQFVKGNSISHADALSRIPLPETVEEVSCFSMCDEFNHFIYFFFRQWKVHH